MPFNGVSSRDVPYPPSPRRRRTAAQGWELLPRLGMTPPLAPPRRKLALCVHFIPLLIPSILRISLAQPGVVGDFAGAFSDHLGGKKKEKPTAERLVASARLTVPFSDAIEVLSTTGREPLDVVEEGN
ncbi:hypothetical protein Q8A73_002382 [Channa argus]|nr:hypothetical protein Q8A73_002382 [Channa argus]